MTTSAGHSGSVASGSIKSCRIIVKPETDQNDKLDLVIHDAV